MCGKFFKKRRDFLTAVLLEEGVELLDVVQKGKARVVVYRDKCKGVYHWYQLEFLEESGEWKVFFRVGDKKIQEAIDLLAEAKQVGDKAQSSPKP